MTTYSNFLPLLTLSLEGALINNGRLPSCVALSTVWGSLPAFERGSDALNKSMAWIGGYKVMCDLHWLKKKKKKKSAPSGIWFGGGNSSTTLSTFVHVIVLMPVLTGGCFGLLGSFSQTIMIWKWVNCVLRAWEC